MQMLQTERLTLRTLTEGDWHDLAEILQDAQVMAAYEGPFDDGMVTDWLQKQLARYREDGFGLWAVIEKETGAFAGQCGITWQDTDAERVLEIGYLFKKAYWHRGYATEAAIACKAYAFDVLGAPSVCSIIRDTNAASIRVAIRNGMRPEKHFVKHYRGVAMPHTVYCVRKGAGEVCSLRK